MNNNNQHYKDCIIEPFYLMANILSVDEFIGFLKGNIIKYAMRAPFKGEAEKDVDKYLYYSSLLREVLTNPTASLEDILDRFKETRGEG